MLSLADRLIVKVRQAKLGLQELLNETTILPVQRDDRAMIRRLLESDYTWGPLSAKGRILQTQTLQCYKQLFSYLDLLFSDCSTDTQTELKQARDKFFYWIERDNGGYQFFLPNSVEELQVQLESVSEEVIRLLEWVKAIGHVGTFFIPDTNALILQPEIDKYGKDCGMERNDYTVVLTPVVLSELDKLRIHRKDECFRKSVESAIKRIKGYRAQGNIHEGVKVHKTITVRMSAAEPNFSLAPHWLDRAVNDDRLIAACFEVQRANPGACVILLTADINLQNKAEMALLPYHEVLHPSTAERNRKRTQKGPKHLADKEI